MSIHFTFSYRIIFAVVTITSVFLYDTQHSCPFARFAGLHLAPINDAAWAVSSGSSNIVLSVCSSDGYITFVRFEDGALGKRFVSRCCVVFCSLDGAALYKVKLSTRQTCLRL